MKGYKGFDKDFKCRGKQYAENTIFEEDNAEICESGMHFRKNPFEVWHDYPPVGDNGNLNTFATVDSLDEPITDDSKNYCTKKLKVGARLSLVEFIKVGVDFTLSKCKKESTNTGDHSASTNTDCCSASTNTGDRSASTNTGICSASANTGYRSASTNTGNCSASTNTGICSASTNTGTYSASTNTGTCSVSANTGDCSVSANTGDCSVSTSTGNRSASTNTGDCSVSANTGDCSVSANTGDCSVSANTGNYSASKVEGKEGVAVAVGPDSKAAGALGCWIALAEWDESHIVNFKSHIVDGKVIKPNVFYKLKNGKFVECEDIEGNQEINTYEKAKKEKL